MSYAKLDYSLVKDLTVADLQQLIKKEVSIANKRLRRLYNANLQNQSEQYNQEFSALLHNTNGFGTKSGYFSSATKEKSKQQLVTQFLQVRNFLASDITVTAVKKEQKARQASFERIETMKAQRSKRTRPIKISIKKTFELVDNLFTDLKNLGFNTNVLGSLYSDILAITKARIESGENYSSILENLANNMNSYDYDTTAILNDFSSNGRLLVKYGDTDFKREEE
jgi:hypothetical protein